MNRGRIFLHAGTHKTGTTSLQKFLFDRREALGERGYAVFEDIERSPIRPRPNAVSTNCLLTAHLFLRDGFGSPIKLRWGVRRYGMVNRVVGLCELRRKLARISHPDIIVSAESFSFLRTWRERLMLKIGFARYRLVPIVFLRERENWLESWDKQVGWLRCKLEKEGRIQGAIADGYREHSLGLGTSSDNGDHDAIRRFFGAEAVFLSYEEAMERWGSIIPAFLAAIGLDPDTFPDHGEYWENRTADKPRFRNR